MTRIISILAMVLFALSISLAGCKKDDAAGGGDKKGGDKSESVAKSGPVADAQKIKEKACACKDAACAQKVSDEMSKFQPKVTSADQANELQAVMKGASECLTKAMTK